MAEKIKVRAAPEQAGIQRKAPPLNASSIAGALNSERP